MIGGLVGGLVGGVAPVGTARPAHAGDPEPYSSSSATRYQVTFVSRSCASFAAISAGQAGAGDDGETIGLPGRDNPYQPGQPVDPDTEDNLGGDCTDLPGWQFTLGSDHERKGPLSTVTGDPVTTPATKDETARLDSAGDETGGLLASAVTVRLTDEQVALAVHRRLWVQGGTPDRPVGDGYAFGALRCGVDGHTGGNVQWLSFPPGFRHIFCYAYYVKGDNPAGTVTVRMRTSRPVGYPQQVPFTSELSFARDGVFTLASSGDPVEASFTRPPTGTGAVPYTVRPRTPSGWRVAEATCTASRPDGGSATSTSSVDPPTGAATITLAAGDTVTCTYTMDPPPAQPGLTLRLFSPGAGGAFGLSLTGAAAPQELTATTTADGTAVTAGGADLTGLASGTYSLTVAPPAAEVSGWTLAGAVCNGTPATVTGLTVRLDVASGVPLECALRLDRKPPSLRLNVVTAGGVATAGFAVVPADTAGAGWSAAADTTGYGVPAPATGDVPGDLPFGSYLVTAVPPRSDLAGGWRLTAFTCDQADAAPSAGAAVRVTLRPGAADPSCTAAYQVDPTTRLRVSLRATGSPSGRQSAAVVEVSCMDGSAGRVVLAPGDGGERTLPEALAFLEPTTCTITQPTTGNAHTSMVKVSAVREPGTGDGPLELPSQVDIDRDVAGYTVTVTDEFSRSVSVSARNQILDEIRALPIMLVGIGAFGLGGLIFLGVLFRRRVV